MQFIPIAALLPLFYLLYFFAKARHWGKLSAIEKSSTVQPLVTIIVPMRNEEASIGFLLKDLIQQSCPNNNYEVIILDDHSTDGSKGVVKAFINDSGCQIDLRLVSLADDPAPKGKSPKKWALLKGIELAKGDIILSTDADVRVGQDWIAEMCKPFSDPETRLCAGPVKMVCDSSLLQQFQALDFAGLMGITGASYSTGRSYMANGANLAYRKNAFHSIGGFEGNWEVAGGDDILLTHKMAKKFPGGLVFQKSKAAIARTMAEATVSSFWQQRLRWTSKNAKYKDYHLTISLVLIYLFNLMLLVSFVGSAGARFALSSPWTIIFLGSLFYKLVSEFRLLFAATGFLGQRYLLWLFLPFQILHIPYVVIIGFWGLFGSFKWKGRSIR